MAITPLRIPDRYYGQPIPVAPDMNQVVDKVDELVDAVNAGLATSNAIVGGDKFVRYMSSQTYGVPADALTLDRLDPATILPGTEATVINPHPNPLAATAASAYYRATIVPAGTAGAVLVPAFMGSPDKLPITWVEVVSNDTFTPLLADELNLGKGAYAGLKLRPLLIALVNGAGTGSSTVVTTPVATPATVGPTVTGFLPASAAVGASVTLTGTGFTKATAVTFNGTTASFQVLNATTIVAVVPAGATTGSVAVTNALGTGTSAASFTVSTTATTTPTPALTAALTISAAAITLGTPLTFTVTPGGGTPPYAYAVVATNNATGATTILVNSASGSFTPPTAGSYNIDATVTDSTNPVKSAPATTRLVQVTATANQLPTAFAGDDVTIQLPTNQVALFGSGADSDGTIAAYKWRQVTGPGAAGGVPATTQNVVATNLIAGTYQFGFQTTDNQGGVSAEDFTVITVLAAVVAPSTPGVSGINPKQGAVGTAVNISGLGFGATRGTGKVYFGNLEATTINIWNDTTVVALCPPNASPARIKVVTNAGTEYVSADDFTPQYSDSFDINTASFGAQIGVVPLEGLINQQPEFLQRYTNGGEGWTFDGTAGGDVESDYVLVPLSLDGTNPTYTWEIDHTFGTGQDLLRAGLSLSPPGTVKPSCLLMQYLVGSGRIELISRNKARNDDYFVVGLSYASTFNGVLPSKPQAIGLGIAAGFYISIHVRMGPKQSDWRVFAYVTTPSYDYNSEYWRPETMASISGAMMRVVSGNNLGTTLKVSEVQAGPGRGFGIANIAPFTTWDGRFLEDGRYYIAGCNLTFMSNNPASEVDNIAASIAAIVKIDTYTNTHTVLCYLSGERDWRGNVRRFGDNSVRGMVDEDGSVLLQLGRWGGIAFGEQHMGMLGYKLATLPRGNVILKNGTEIPFILPASQGGGQDVYGYDNHTRKLGGKYSHLYATCANGGVQIRGVYRTLSDTPFGPQTLAAQLANHDSVIKEGPAHYHDSCLFTDGESNTTVTNQALQVTGAVVRTDTGATVNPSHPSIVDMRESATTAQPVWDAVDNTLLLGGKYTQGYLKHLIATRKILNITTPAFGIPAIYQ